MSFNDCRHTHKNHHRGATSAIKHVSKYDWSSSFSHPNFQLTAEPQCRILKNISYQMPNANPSDVTCSQRLFAFDAVNHNKHTSQTDSFKRRWWEQTSPGQDKLKRSKRQFFLFTEFYGPLGYDNHCSQPPGGISTWGTILLQVGLLVCVSQTWCFCLCINLLYLLHLLTACWDNMDSVWFMFVRRHSRLTMCRVQIHPGRCPSTTCMAPGHHSYNLIFPSSAAFNFFPQMAPAKGL